MYLVDWFESLSSSRGMSEVGLLGLSPADVKAWSDLSGLGMTPAEFRLISIMDEAYLSASRVHREEQLLYLKSKNESRKG